MKKLLVTLLIIIPIFSYSSNLYSSDTILTDSTESQTMFDIRRNAVYTEDLIMYSYERILPISAKFGLILKGGILIWDPIMPVAEIAAITGGNKHFFEAGTGAIIDVIYGGGFFTIRAGYRYQAPKGFLLKVSGIYSPDNFLLPWITIGYSF